MIKDKEDYAESKPCDDCFKKRLARDAKLRELLESVKKTLELEEQFNEHDCAYDDEKSKCLERVKEALSLLEGST
jgi:hypothetical protein